ncbi:MAG: serine--tRNA ligase [Formosa sp.]|jgi:seryl-tRNA synthetase|nr:serine--tRNA ligase [Formosa sp.]MDC0462911.1 serine--tRNA ligase [Flavobacteriaceae bacterium]MDC3198605.1 serine--tRNA ligase [Flavobacteriaceae bacterium]|tara:strand:+ start:317 stop:1588 length:1272 start_codon:yes stop_codon:yes gene_type:complete
MLQVSYIREHQTEVIERLSKRTKEAATLIEAVLKIDETRRGLQAKVDVISSELNVISKQIGELFKTGQAHKANDFKLKTNDLKQTKATLSEELNTAVDSLQALLYKIPNLPNAIVPKGSSEDDNEEIFSAGVIPVLSENAIPHWELAKKYDIIDFDLGNKITGAGFPVYKGKGARLQRALINYFLDKNTAAGYNEIQVPHLVNEASGFGTGQLPDKEGQMYHVGEDDLYLIPTAEVPATNIFRDVLLQESELPKTLTAYTPCFRREAGSYGAHVRGLNRLHQFDKVEILRVEHPSNSYTALDGMVDHIKSILEELKLPYRVLKLCSGDLGFTAALTYDFEVFSTAQGRWLEISSVSNFETYQANRLKLRFKNAEGKSELAHTLNGSSLALPRVLAGILENYQTDQGIHVPKVLIPYTGFKIID